MSNPVNQSNPSFSRKVMQWIYQKRWFLAIPALFLWWAYKPCVTTLPVAFSNPPYHERSMDYDAFALENTSDEIWPEAVVQITYRYGSFSRVVHDWKPGEVRYFPKIYYTYNPVIRISRGPFCRIFEPFYIGS